MINGEGGGATFASVTGYRCNLDKRQACNARENPYPEQAELSGLLQVVPVHEYRGFKAQNQGAKARRAKKIPDAPARPGRRKADSLKVSASSPRPEESIARIPERFGAAVREISNPKKSARNTIVLSGTCHARKNGRNRGSGALTKARADMDGGGGTSSEFNGLQDARIAAINRESLRKKFTFADLKKIRTATLAVLFYYPALRVKVDNT